MQLIMRPGAMSRAFADPSAILRDAGVRRVLDSDGRRLMPTLLMGPRGAGVAIARPAAPQCVQKAR